MMRVTAMVDVDDGEKEEDTDGEGVDDRVVKMTMLWQEARHRIMIRIRRRRRKMSKDTHHHWSSNRSRSTSGIAGGGGGVVLHQNAKLWESGILLIAMQDCLQPRWCHHQ